MKSSQVRLVAALAMALMPGILMSGCGDDDDGMGPEGRPVTVLTRNLYVGTSFAAILSVQSAEQIPAAVAQTFAEIEASNFPERAREIAGEIEEENPHLVGLQEVTLVQRQSPGDFFQGNPAPATEVVVDFVEVLLSELAARGLDYERVATSTGLSVELPSSTGDDLRVTDHEVILARSDVEITNVREANFDTNLTLRVGGGAGADVLFLRGYVSVDATLDGEAFRFVSTHLEQQAAEPIQLAQAGEIIAEVGVTDLPLVLVGDFNSAADSSQTATYPTLIAAGFEDVWSVTHPGDPGFTCCQQPDLLNPVPTLDQRLDLVLVRGDVEALEVEILGEEPGDRTPSGLWPADHAGVVATLDFE